MTPKKNKQLLVECPKCKLKFSYYDSACRPFCSEKCQQVDLGNWFLEKYAVPVTTPLDQKEQEELEKVLQEKFASEDEY